MSVVVSEITVMNEEYGLEATVTVKRYLPRWIGDKRANAADLPPDICQALREWLEEAK